MNLNVRNQLIKYDVTANNLKYAQDYDDFIHLGILKTSLEKIRTDQGLKNTHNIEGVKYRDETPNTRADQSKEARSKRDGAGEGLSDKVASGYDEHEGITKTR